MDVRKKAQQLAATLALEAELTSADRARLTFRLERDLKTARIWLNTLGPGRTYDADWYVEVDHRRRLGLHPVPPPRHGFARESDS
jgi:hypothetical protein